MNKGFWMIWFAFTLYSAWGQSGFGLLENSEGKIIVIPREAQFDLTIDIPEATYKSYTPATTNELERRLQEFQPDYQSTSINQRPMDMQVLSGAYEPFYNPFVPMLATISPSAFDFRETSVVSINDQFAFLATGMKSTWPAAGGITTITSALSWQKDRLTLTGNVMGGHYSSPFNPSPEYVVGGGVNARYEVTDWLSAIGWGQYMHYSGQEKYNPHVILNTFYPHTSAGGALEIKVSENFGFGVGVNYQYNPRYRKMEPQYMLYPVFKSGHFQIGMW